MCLYTRWKKSKKAKKDIIIYKILDKDCVSPYQGFMYTLGTKYNTIMRRRDSLFDGGFFIDDGFHAFTNRIALLNSDSKKYFIGAKAFKCIIPKGSSYYISSCKRTIVSDSIIIKRRLLFNIF